MADRPERTILQPRLLDQHDDERPGSVADPRDHIAPALAVAAVDDMHIRIIGIEGEARLHVRDPQCDMGESPIRRHPSSLSGGSRPRSALLRSHPFVDLYSNT